MIVLRRWVGVLCVTLLSLPVWAAEVDVDVAESDSENQALLSYSLENLIYSSRIAVRQDGLYNPENKVVNYPQQWSVMDFRGKLQLDDGVQTILLQPRLRWQETDYEHAAAYAGLAAKHVKTDFVLDQAFWRWNSGSGSILFGREVFTWGPATFRSPSSPVYFDAGKADPLSLLSGLDMLRYSYAMDALTATLGYVHGSSAVGDVLNYQNMMQLKMDYQDADSLLSINMARQFDRASNISFLGGFIQRSVADAWLLYAEAGQMRLQQGEMSSQLLGLSYTFAGGQVLTAEYLHGRSDWGRMNGRQRLDKGVMAGLPPATWGDAGLWGRNYLWLSLNGNVQNSQQFWRLELTSSLDDGSVNVGGYYEKSINKYLTGFVHASHGFGGAAQEFGGLVRSTFTLGVKWFAF